MFKNNKKGPIGSVLKLFKVIDIIDLALYSPRVIKNVISLSIDSFFRNDIFNRIELNYGIKRYKELTVFLDEIDGGKGNLEIVDLIISSNKSSNKILYSNRLLNQVQKEDSGVIELDICSEFNDINKDIVYPFIEELVDVFPIDYGYVLPFENGMDVRSERIVKRSFWSSSVSVTKEDILRRDKSLSINDGFLPKLYPINVLNHSQLDFLKNSNISMDEIIEVGDTLYLVVLNN